FHRARSHVVQVDRVSATGDRVGEVSPRQHVLEGQDIVANDVTGFAHTDLVGRAEQSRLGKSRDSPPKETEDLEHLALSLHVGSTERVGSRPVDSVYPRRIDGDVAGGGAGLDAEAVALYRELPGRPTFSHQRGERVHHDRRVLQVLARVIRAADPALRQTHLFGVCAKEVEHGLGVDIPDPEDPRRRLHETVALTPPDDLRAGPRGDVTVARGVHEHTAQYALETALAGKEDPADSSALHECVYAERVQEELDATLCKHGQQDLLEGKGIGSRDRAHLLVGAVL